MLVRLVAGLASGTSMFTGLGWYVRVLATLLSLLLVVMVVVMMMMMMSSLMVSTPLLT